MKFFMKPYRREALVCLLLAAAILWLYAPVCHYDFVILDDSMNVYENPHIQAGITRESVKWALTTREDYWRPLTRLSHLLDVEWFGMDAGAHHRTNVVLHTANALLLFGILRRMTGSVWRSAFVAAAFALHPLRVESVAWITERKDMLSALFWMLTLGAYLQYVRSQQSEVRDQANPPSDFPPSLCELRRTSRFLTSGSYWLTFVFFAVGLMAKPMLITLPFALLLLDFWPLGRWREGVRSQVSGVSGKKVGSQNRQSPIANRQSFLRLIAEKIPLFALAFASLAWTVVAQHSRGLAVDFTKLPLTQRIGNALISYVDYLWLTLRPVNLAVMYSNVVPFTVWQVIGSVTLLLLITAAVLWRMRRQPYLFSGWFWYAGTLLPTAGLVQVGEQRMADRFTYLPIIGILIIIAWGVPDLLSRWRHGKKILPVCAAAALAACVWATAKQLPVWENSKTLFEHALKAGHESPTVHINLGLTLADAGRTAEAMEHYRRALQLNPGFVEAHNNLATLLAHAGRTADAMEHYREALRQKPNYAEAHNNLGNLLARAGRTAEAMEHYQEALRLKPNYAEAYNNLGGILMSKGRLNEAREYFQEAVRLKPDYVDAINGLGVALAAQQRMDEAVRCFEEVLRLRPDSADARDNLKLVLMRKNQTVKTVQSNQQAGREGREKPMETVAQLREMLAQHPDNVSALNNLAWRLATAPDAALRDGAEAVRLAERAVQLSGGNSSALLDTLAAAYAEAGRFDDAVKTAERAAELARAAADETQVQQIETHVELYRKGSPLRQP